MTMQSPGYNLEEELPAFKRIKVTLGILHIHLILSGLLDVVLGAFISHDVQRNTPRDQILIIWMVGVPLILTGALGLYTLRKTTKIVTIAWIIIAVGSNTGAYLYMSLTWQMETETFGVNLNVYGQCKTDHAMCLCQFPEQTALGVLFSSCEAVRLRTTLFIVLVSSFSLALATLMITLFLTPVKDFWLPTCLDKKEEDLRLYTTHGSGCTTEKSVVPRSTSKCTTSSTYNQPLLPINESTQAPESITPSTSFPRPEIPETVPTSTSVTPLLGNVDMTESEMLTVSTDIHLSNV